MSLRTYLTPHPTAVAPSPLRRSLSAHASVRTALRKSQARTHDREHWGFSDFDDPGEAIEATLRAWEQVDQEAVEGRAHRPGYHADGYVEKSGAPKAPPRVRDAAHQPERRRALPPGAHRTPPQGYPSDRRQYAIPGWYALPLDTKKHAADAASRFPQMDAYDHLSAPAKRRIWRRIVAAEHHFGSHPDPQVLRAAGLSAAHFPKGA